MSNEEKSIHLTKWPTSNKSLISPEDEKIGELIIKVIALIRKLKAERKTSLKTQLKKAIVYVKEEDKEALNKHLDLISQVCFVNTIEIKPLKDESEIKVEIII